MQGRRNIKTFGRGQACKAKSVPLIGIELTNLPKHGTSLHVLIRSGGPDMLRYRGSVKK